MKLIKGKIYMITWVDTFSTHGWLEVKEMDRLCKKNKEWIHTVGFYVGEKSGYEVLCSQFTPNDEMINFANMVAIPKGCIKKVERLQ